MRTGDTALDTLRGFICGQLHATIGNKEAVFEEFVLEIVNVVPHEREANQAKVVGRIWRRAPHEERWIRSIHTHCFVWLERLEEISDMTLHISGYFDGMDTDFAAVVLAPGHVRMVEELDEATVTVEDLVNQHRSVRLTVAAIGRTLSILDVLIPNGDRVGVVRIDYTCDHPDVIAYRINVIHLETYKDMRRVAVFGSMDMGAGKGMPLEGRATTVREAIQNAYENAMGFRRRPPY